MVTSSREEDVDPALFHPRVQEYRADFNAYNPQFKGLPPGSYPKPWYEWVLDVLLLFPLYIFCALAMYGCIAWGTTSPVSYGWAMIGLAVLFWIILLSLCFIYAPRRRKTEREYIERKIGEQKREKELQKAKQEKVQEMLAAYRAEKS